MGMRTAGVALRLRLVVGEPARRRPRKGVGGVLGVRRRRLVDGTLVRATDGERAEVGVGEFCLVEGREERSVTLIQRMSCASHASKSSTNVMYSVLDASLIHHM